MASGKNTHAQHKRVKGGQASSLKRKGLHVDRQGISVPKAPNRAGSGDKTSQEPRAYAFFRFTSPSWVMSSPPKVTL